MKKKFKIVFVGGGTGGHLFPLISVIRELKRIFPEGSLEMSYIGPREKLAEEYIEREGVRVKYILTGKLRRYLGLGAMLRNIVDMIKIPIGITQSFFYMFFHSPDLIFSKGSHGSFPPVISGRVLQIPIFLHESDVIPGAANRFLQRLALEVFVSFQGTKNVSPEKMVTVGNPIRREIMNGSAEEARKIFSLSGGKPVILVMGGSQGSERINELILTILGSLLDSFEVIHQCGEKSLRNVATEANAVIPEKEKRERYHAYPFFSEEQMRAAYAVADLVISRAGSGSIFEISANGKPSILIPLPEAAQDHQTKNAYVYTREGTGVVIEEENLTPNFFLERLKSLFYPKEQLNAMGEKAKSFSNPRAAKVVASYIKEYLTGK